MTKDELLSLVDDVINAAINFGAAQEVSSLLHYDKRENETKVKLDKAKNNLVEILEAIRAKELRDL